MKNYENEVIVEKMSEIFAGQKSYEDIEITVKPYKENGYEIEVSKMYDYVEVNLDALLKMSEIFGTTNITVDEESFGGCDTCDYGSSYVKTFFVRDHEKEATT